MIASSVENLREKVTIIILSLHLNARGSSHLGVSEIFEIENVAIPT